jgi:multisubunit Na+/H+ antiporter MnhG subunit
VSARDAAVWTLLGAGAAVELACCLALLGVRSAEDRLHLTAPASILGPLLIGAAVVTRIWWRATSLKMIVVALVLVASGPLLVHATGRALAPPGFVERSREGETGAEGERP